MRSRVVALLASTSLLAGVGAAVPATTLAAKAPRCQKGYVAKRVYNKKTRKYHWRCVKRP